MKLNIKPHLFTYLSISIYLCFNCSISWSQCEESTISCFASTYSNSINSNDINQYSEHCGFTEYDGGEDIVRIEVTSVPATILLNNLNSDLDLFIYGDCSNGLAFLTNCVEFSRNSSINDEVIVVNNTGTYWAIIEGFQGANSAYTLSLVCPNTCNNAEEIYCGETLIRNTLNDSNDFNIFDYSSCYSSSNNFSGSDMIFQFERYSFSQVNYITLQSGQEDLDIFILDNCSPNSNCIDFSVRSVTCGSGQSLSSCYPSGTNVDVVELVNYPAGTYYIVIDGFNSQQAGPFSLSLSCEGINCQGATPIGCNAVVTGSNVGSYNGSSAYDTECFTPSAAQGMFTSGEVLYEFTAPEDGDYDICLTAMPIAIDLELFIISECCPVDVEPGNGGPYYISTSSCLEDCASGATSSNGQETETVSLLAGESIIIIVDGFLGAESQFTLEVKCQDPCDDIIWSVIDDQGNPACSDIVINGISQSSNNTISPNFQPIQTALDFERWEVRNANTGQVLEINTINSQNFNYCCFQPGNEYYICYWYRNIDGCLEFCCIKYELPNNCTFINPRFTGNENNLTYSLDVEGLTSSQSVVAWYDGTNTNPIGSANNISYSPYSTGIRNICCIIYDSVIRGYIMCCRTICVDNPYSCNTFTSSYNQTNDEYTFTAVGSGQNITWYLDAPTSAIIGFNNPQTFRPLLYNVPSGSPFQVSYRYQDSDGCTRFCCKTLTPAPTIDPVIFYIGEECGGIDEIVNIPIRVRKFNEIRGFTFGISLAQNIGVIEDVTVANQELESTLVIYNSIVSSDGQKVDVIGGTSNIVTLPDNSVILMIQVRISNSVFVETDVIFSNVPEPIASVGAGSLSIPITTIDGELCYEESNASINGRIYTEESIGVSDVSVDLNGTMISSVLTDQNGFYDIIDLQSGDEYMITPNRNVINYDAINISDLVRMIDHILATDYIDSPYKLIAADINEDERITISDLTLLIDMILRRSINLDPWIFVDQDYNFTPNSLSITQNYPRNKIVSNLSNDITGLDFIGILKGDLDGSFSGLKEDALPPLKKSCLGFNLQDFNVSENEELDIIISLDTFEFLRSLSAELSFDPNKIEILEVTQSNSALGNNLSVETSNKDQGYLKLLWFTLTSNGESFADGSELMTVKVRGLQQTLLSEAIQISSDFLESETINSANEEGCINLEFEEIISSVEFDETYFSEIKVYPNPWIKETILNIDLPNNETVLFQIRNLEGKLLFKKTLNLVAGTNEIIISDDMINNNHGLMFYSLGNESFQYTNKLIRLK